MSAWFDDLCSALPGDTRRVSAALEPLSRMDSNAVPFLVKQLNYDQRGTIERIELGAQKLPILAPFLHPVLPTTRRNYAAFSLGNLETNAVFALRPMIEAFQREPRHDVRRNTVVAMGKIVGVRPDGHSHWQEFEWTVLERVRKAYPRFGRRTPNAQQAVRH